MTALPVCAVIATLFLGDIGAFDVSSVEARLFLVAMTTFFVALVLREFLIATAAMQIGRQ